MASIDYTSLLKTTLLEGGKLNANVYRARDTGRYRWSCLHLGEAALAKLSKDALLQEKCRMESVQETRARLMVLPDALNRTELSP